MSKRSKRRRDPRTAAKEGARDAQRAGRGARPPEASGAPRGRPPEASGGSRGRPPDASGGSRGRPPEASGASRGRPAAAAQDRAAGASSWSLGVQIAFAVAVFAVVSLVAELAGAANLGVALGIGQVAFAIAVTYLLVRR